jgi:hypothetical protein
LKEAEATIPFDESIEVSLVKVLHPNNGFFSISLITYEFKERKKHEYNHLKPIKKYICLIFTFSTVVVVLVLP